MQPSEEETRRVIIILANAPLETVKCGGSKKGKDDGSYQLLNCDDHQGLLKRHNREIAEMRPDISHQVTKGIVIIKFTL